MATTAMAVSQASTVITPSSSASIPSVALSSSTFTVPPLLNSPWASLPDLSSSFHHGRRSRSSRLIYGNNGDFRIALTPGKGSCPLVIRASDAGDAAVVEKVGKKVIHGKCFVVRDNIDTDQIIPAEYLTLVPSKRDEYEKLGSYALIGLPPHYGKFVEDGKNNSEYRVVIAGANFGCGSSREHAPVALGAAGVRAVVAESFARIFFRNSVATGEIYPVETESRICDENKTGDIVTVDLEHEILVNHTSGKQFPLLPIGDAGPVIDAGGIFNFARATGMISTPA